MNFYLETWINVPVFVKSFIQYKVFVALPGKVAPKTQKGCHVNPVHMFSVLHIAAQVELSQQDLGSFFLLYNSKSKSGILF
jgi:hypothetical protein